LPIIARVAPRILDDGSLGAESEAATMGVVGVVDISVALGRFRNVDLFQRGFYNMQVYFNIAHAMSLSFKSTATLEEGHFGILHQI
jgi:hypothetical protein